MKFFNSKNKKNPESSFPNEPDKKGELELRDMIAPAALKINARDIELGDKFVKTFFIISFPRILTDSWFSAIVNLDRVFDVSIFIHPEDTARMLKKFQKKVAEVQSQINMQADKGVVRDPVLETAYQDLEDLRDSLQRAEEKIFSVGIYISIYADNAQELKKRDSELKSLLESKLIHVRPAMFQQEEGFQSIIPLGEDKLKVHQKLNSSPLSSIFPFVSFDLTSDHGILYGINRHNSSLVLFDRFSLENFNSVTFATSGSGKSYATKLEIIRSLMFGTDVIVIDPENEYQYLAQATGGRFFDISLVSEHHINPFELTKAGDDESPANVLRSNVITLVGLFRLMFGGLTPEEDSIVDRAITETYAMKDITPESDFENIEPPLLSDFELILSGMEGAENLALKLSKYTQGSWAGFLNEPTNVDIDNKFIVFSIRDMEDDLKPIAMFIVTHYIWNAIRRNLRKRLLVVDEAWWMMKSKDTASFLFGLVKRGRKYYLGVATITQDVNDFLLSPYGLPIITNSSMRLLLKQSSASISILQKTFNLTEEEKYLLLESGLGEGIFFAGMKHVALKIIASYTEDQIITSDPSQILAIKKAKEELKNSGNNNGNNNF